MRRFFASVYLSCKKGTNNRCIGGADRWANETKNLAHTRFEFYTFPTYALDTTAPLCTQVVLTEAELWTVIIQITEGLAYVASEGIVHADVAARNILLHTHNNVQVRDDTCTCVLMSADEC